MNAPIPRSIALAASIQASMDQLSAELGRHDPELLAPVLERVLAGAVEQSGQWRQDQLYWIADEALRRAAKR